MDDDGLGQGHIEKFVRMTSGFEGEIHSEGTGDFHVFTHENHGIAVLVG